MRFFFQIVLITGLITTDGLSQQNSEGNPFQRHREPVIYLYRPYPIGGYPAIQALIVYPDAALAQKLEGTVIIRCVIDIDGYAREVLPILGPEVLFNAAIDAVELSQWRPARLDGQPVAGQVQFALDFHLPGSGITPSQDIHEQHIIRNLLHNLALGSLVMGLVFLSRGYLF